MPEDHFGPDVAANAAGNSTVQLPITLAASQTFSCTIPSLTDRLFLSGSIDLGAFTLTIDSASGSVIIVNGVISNTGGVTSSGGGIVFIVVNDTYTGPTNVSAGNCVLAGASLSNASAVTVTGGILQYANGASTGPVTATAGTVTCQGGGTSQIGNVTDLTLAALGRNEFAWLVKKSGETVGDFRTRTAHYVGSAGLGTEVRGA